MSATCQTRPIMHERVGSGPDGHGVRKDGLAKVDHRGRTYGMISIARIGRRCLDIREVR